MIMTITWINVAAFFIFNYRSFRIVSCFRVVQLVSCETHHLENGLSLEGD